MFEEIYALESAVVAYETVIRLLKSLKEMIFVLMVKKLEDGIELEKDPLPDIIVGYLMFAKWLKR